MGRYITCSCGQRNDIDAYQFGEARQCHRCGTMLPREADYYKSEEFTPQVSGFAGDLEGDSTLASEFESPSGLAREDAAIPPPTVERAWEGRVREVVTDTGEASRCVRCNRSFRGAWDQHVHADGILCHICSTQAQTDYKAPDDRQRMELYRAVPPRKVEIPPDPEKVKALEKKRRGMIVLAVATVATLVLVNVLPVESWIAFIFSADPAKSADLPAAWYWVSWSMELLVTILGHGIVLYGSLKWTGLLYEGDLRENLATLTYLAVAFSLMDGILGTNIITLIVKLLMISERYPLRFEGGLTFLFTWSLCSLLLWPCNIAIHQLIQGIVSAIAL